jgi:hypothetical protein
MQLLYDYGNCVIRYPLLARVQGPETLPTLGA